MWDICNRRSAQQESGASLSKNSMFVGEANINVLCGLLVKAESGVSIDSYKM